jgi:hypothetical protein
MYIKLQYLAYMERYQLILVFYIKKILYFFDMHLVSFQEYLVIKLIIYLKILNMLF